MIKLNKNYPANDDTKGETQFVVNKLGFPVY
jgi:hypothetical protein